LVISLLDRLPIIGDKLDWQEWSMTVVEVESRRVTKVLLKESLQKKGVFAALFVFRVLLVRNARGQ
jgi:CBS domain containing-hemolysin-like protein